MHADSQGDRPFTSEPLLRGLGRRLLQIAALYAPGQTTVRVWLHRLRGVRIGSDVRIGTDVLIETAFPEWVRIGDHVIVSMRSTIIAHFEGSLPPVRERTTYVSVRIEDEVFVGPGSMILPNVTIGRGSVVTAGSVVTRSIPPMTMVQGNPARPIAHCEIPLTYRTPLKKFLSKLRPIHEAEKLPFE